MRQVAWLGCRRLERVVTKKFEVVVIQIQIAMIRKSTGTRTYLRTIASTILIFHEPELIMKVRKKSEKIGKNRKSSETFGKIRKNS